LKFEQPGLGVDLERQRVQRAALGAAALAIRAPQILEGVETGGSKVAGGRGNGRPSTAVEESELFPTPAGARAVVHEPARTPRTYKLFVLLLLFVFPSLKFTFHAFVGLFWYVEDDQ